MSKKTNAKKVILINNVVVGGYGYNEDNLPHEMINFFRADNGGYYVYVTPYGAISSDLSIQNMKAILFVRSAGDGLVEVLAKADVDSTNEDEFFTQGVTINGDETDDENYKNIKGDKHKQRYHKLVNKENIQYGGVSLTNIHKSNKKDNEVLVTMKVKSICLPKKTFYLTNKKENEHIRPDVVYVGGKKLANQSMKAYFYEDSEGYASLLNVIGDTEGNYWHDPSATPTYSSATIKTERNFFRVIRQQDNEVVFSSVLHHYLATYADFRAAFLKGVLGIADLSSDCLVEREKDHMDIRLVDEKHYIIIENKIKSGVNGLKENKDKTFRTDESGKYYSQLSDYYQIAKASGKTVHAFIFAPNYNDAINPNYIRDTFVDGEQYAPISYEVIHKFFENHLAAYKDQIDYYEDFTNALKKHTVPVDNEHRDVLLNRLAKRIAVARLKQNP